VRRFPRILLNATTAFSLLLFVTFLVIALRGITHFDGWSLVRGDRETSITSNWGQVSFLVSRPAGRSPGLLHHHDEVWQDMPWELTAPGPMTKRRAAFGFGFARGRQPAFTLVTTPSWLPVFLTALLPAWRLPLIWRGCVARRRIGKRSCPTCGYDLRATPDRCPECGTSREP
jgi:hypothetical protein